MAAQIFLLPFRPAIGPNSLVLPGAQLAFYLSGTLTKTNVYTDSTMGTALPNPVVANAAGVWPNIYFDNTVTYRVILSSPENVVLKDADPYLPGVIDNLTPAFQALVDQAAVSATTATTKATEASGSAAAAASTAADLGGISNTYKAKNTTLNTSGSLISIEDGGGRNIVGFDAAGTLFRSNTFISTLVSLANTGNTLQSIKRLSKVPRLLSSASIWGITYGGQSNAAGSGSPAITLTQPFNNKRVVSGSFVPLVEGGNESGLSATCNGISARLRDNTPPWIPLAFDLVGNNMGAGGTPYSGIKKGTAPYNAGLAAVTTAKNLAVASGKTYAEMALPFLHGESDAGAGISRAQYLANLIEYKNDWNTDVLAVTGQTNRIPLFIQQKAVSGDGLGGSVTSLAMLDAAETDSEIFITAPGYIFDSTDGLHYSNYSQDWQGEYLAKAVWRYYVEGRTPSTVRPIKYERLNSNEILGTFLVPAPPLVWDLEGVWPLDAGLGFTLRNTSTNAELALARSPVIVSPTQVLLTTVATLPASVTVAYATKIGAYGNTGGIGLGRTRGARGNLRDSDDTPSS